jgi:hypothetical protein
MSGGGRTRTGTGTGTAGGIGFIPRPSISDDDLDRATGDDLDRIGDDPGRENGDGPGRYGRRFAAPLVVLSAGALLVVGVANVQVARQRDDVDRDLAAARVAASRVAEHLSTGDLDALDGDLELLARAGVAAVNGSTGFGWAVADRADLGPAQVRSLRRDTARMAGLATEAVALRDRLTPLTTPGPAGASMIGPEGPNGLYALDDLARGLNGYASAAERIDDPSAAVLGRSALAAGTLPGLAGADGPRIWTVCRVAGGPCVRVKVADARSGSLVPRPVPSAVPTSVPGSTSPPGRRPVMGVDVLVVGVDPVTLFPHHGGFDTAAIFDLLYHLNSAPRSSPTVTIRSAVDTEQQAIDLLSRP